MAVTRIARELLAAGLIEEAEISDRKPRNKTVGRPKTGLHIVPTGVYAAGITVSAYHSEVSICDANGKPVASRRLEDMPLYDATEAAKFYATALRDLINSAEIDPLRIVGIGVALSARTDPTTGRIIKSEYFGWGDDEGQFCREVRKVIDVPVEIENIANALAIAEMRFGAAQGVSEFTLVHAATFVGASVVSDSRPVRGVSGVSGLLGHFRSVTRPLTCVCGRHDCLNLSATGFGLLSQMGRLDHPSFDRSKLSFYAISLLEVLKDSAAKDLIQHAGFQLAPALDSIRKLLGPERIILTGHLGTNDIYFAATKDALNQEFDFGDGSSCTLVKGEITSVESAALLALHAFCYSDQLDFDRFPQELQKQGQAYG